MKRELARTSENDRGDLEMTISEQDPLYPFWEPRCAMIVPGSEGGFFLVCNQIQRSIAFSKDKGRLIEFLNSF